MHGVHPIPSHKQVISSVRSISSSCRNATSTKSNGLPTLQKAEDKIDRPSLRTASRQAPDDILPIESVKCVRCYYLGKICVGGGPGQQGVKSTTCDSCAKVPASGENQQECVFKTNQNDAAEVWNNKDFDKLPRLRSALSCNA